MQNVLVNPETREGKLVVQELKKIGLNYCENDIIALYYTEGEDYGTIFHNFNNTQIRINLSDIDFEELKYDGILIWPTWEANI